MHHCSIRGAVELLCIGICLFVAYCDEPEGTPERDENGKPLQIFESGPEWNSVTVARCLRLI